MANSLIVTIYDIIHYIVSLCLCCDACMVGGTIAEPGNPSPMIDLSHLTVQDSCIFFCALPIAGLIQLYDLVLAVVHMFVALFCGLRSSMGFDIFGLLKLKSSDDEVNSDDEEVGGIRVKGRKKKRGILTRLVRTIW